MSRYIGTYTGRCIDLLNPTPDDIDVKDLEWHLSAVNRWVGATGSAISVAEHSVLVASLFTDPYDQLAALTHDASEGYLGDVTRSLKALLPEYRKIEEAWMGVMAERFGVRYDSPALKLADNAVLLAEMQQHANPRMREVLRRNGFDFDTYKPAALTVSGWGRTAARNIYGQALEKACQAVAA